MLGQEYAYTPYDEIACEYYSDQHLTCRNFDAVTLSGLEQQKLSIPEEGKVLEVGCGRGFAHNYLNIKNERVVQLDSSMNMLSLENREPCILRIHSDAEKLPFVDGEFVCVIGFLCDAFIGLNFLTEAYRVLAPNGCFVATVPTEDWALNYRLSTNCDLHEAEFFKIQTKEKVILPSFINSASRLTTMLRMSGFGSRDEIEINPLKLPPNFSEDRISPTVLEAAKYSGKPVNQLDILYLLKALK